MPTRHRWFLIAYMTIAILALLLTLQNILLPNYFNAFLTFGVFLLCSWQIYRLLPAQK
jgi:uncharacterized MnhB-related membrane protein